MDHVILVIHLILTLALIVLILLQRSEGGGLGLGGGGGGMGGFATPQATANALTKATTFVAVCFFATSLILAIIAARGNGMAPSSILDAVDNPPAASSSTGPEGPVPAINSESGSTAPDAKPAPAVPIAK